MNLTLERKLIAGLVFLSAIVFLLGWKTYMNNRTYQNTFYWIEHTENVLLVSEEIASTTKDLERGIRGYVITKDTTFLKPFSDFKGEVVTKISELKQLTSDNPDQQERIDTLQYYLKKRINTLQASLDIANLHGFEHAKKLILTKEGFNYMNRVLATISDIQAEERLLLKTRKEANAESNRAFNRLYLTLLGILVIFPIGFFCVLYRTLIKRREAEASLAQNRELLQSIIDNTSSIIYIKDLKGRFTLVNKEFERSHSLSSKEVIGKTVFDFCPKPYALKYTEADQKALNERTLIEVQEDALIHGKLYHYYSIKFPLYRSNGELYALGGISTNITDIITRQQLEKQKEIVETTIQAQEKERTEIARELHDNVNQLLATARLMIDAGMSLPEMHDTCLQKSKHIINEAINEIRTISHSMMPPSFENDAFVEAIRDIATNINMNGDLFMKIQMPTTEQLNTLDNDLKLCLYRIIQEQVSNTVKYSKATTASITLEHKNDYVLLSIIDNGIGANMEKQRKGIGLRNIASRVDFFNGEMKITTAPNQGFHLFTKFFIGEETQQRLLA